MVNIFGDRGDGEEEKGSIGERRYIGPAGRRGPPGVKGDVGKEGAQGERGAIGSVGKTGLSGAKGNVGKEGVRGPRGVQGVGGLVGKQGERGPYGVEELCLWLPAFILHEFRNTESCSYFFPTDGSGFQKSGDVINKLVSHSTHPIMLEKSVDAVAVKGSSTTIPIPNRKDRLALQFTSKMLYKASGIKLSHFLVS